MFLKCIVLSKKLLRFFLTPQNIQNGWARRWSSTGVETSLHTMLIKQLYRFCLFIAFLFCRWTQVYWTLSPQNCMPVYCNKYRFITLKLFGFVLFKCTYSVAFLWSVPYSQSVLLTCTFSLATGKYFLKVP